MNAQAFHARLPGYAPTPLHDVPALAERFGVGQVRVKDESERLGLPAFKVLGASWGAYRALCDRLGGEPRDWEHVDELRDAFAPLGAVRLLTATDGNHGRALARVARWFGLDAVVLLPHVAAPSVRDAIASEGADVRVTELPYDDAVARAGQMAKGDPSFVLVQDTAWPGYEQVPAWIVEGYGTLFAEIDAEVTPGLVVVPTGVGSLLQAAVAHYSGRDTRVLCVEPDTAACVLESLRAGAPVSVPTGETVMAGLNCGRVSSAAWPVLRDGLGDAVAVSDADALRAVETLAAHGISSGPSGAASLAGFEAARERLALDAGSTVVLLSTEAAR